MKDTNNLAILASHNASNLSVIVDAIENNILNMSIKILISNNTNAQALSSAKKFNIKNKLINNKLYDNTDEQIYKVLKKLDCKYILLSGYMKKVSSILTNNFIIINTHPALLPSYGGAGMYGRFVHEAVIKNNEKISGITIHYVNENYDEGEIILQEELTLLEDETISSLESRIKKLEQSSIIRGLNLCLK